MICKRCGANNKASAFLCSNCGAILSSIDDDNNDVKEEIEEKFEPENKFRKNKNKDKKKKKKNLNNLFLYGMIVFIAFYISKGYILDHFFKEKPAPSVPVVQVSQEDKKDIEEKEEVQDTSKEMQSYEELVLEEFKGLNDKLEECVDTLKEYNKFKPKYIDFLDQVKETRGLLKEYDNKHGLTEKEKEINKYLMEFTSSILETSKFIDKYDKTQDFTVLSELKNEIINISSTIKKIIFS